MFGYEKVGPVALYLACKSDSPRSYRHIAHVLARTLKLNPTRNEIQSCRREFVATEIFMLTLLANDLNTTEHPYNTIKKACALFNITKSKHLNAKMLRLLLKSFALGQENLLAAIFSVANKSLRVTTFCIRYPPALVAAFSIFMGTQWANHKVG